MTYSWWERLIVPKSVRRYIRNLEAAATTGSDIRHALRNSKQVFVVCHEYSEGGSVFTDRAEAEQRLREVKIGGGAFGTDIAAWIEVYPK